MPPDWRQALTNEGHEPRPGATAAAIAEVERALAVALPADLRDLYLASDGVYDEPGEWFPIWPLADVAEHNQTWTPPNLLAFGDDGTGAPLCVARDGAPDVYSWSSIDGEATWLAPSVREFWRGWSSGSITT